MYNLCQNNSNLLIDCIYTERALKHYTSDMEEADKYCWLIFLI